MTPDDVRAFFDALSAGDFSALERRLAEDVVLEFPGRRFGGRFEGARRVRVFMRQNQRMFRTGLRFTVSWAAVAGDRAVAAWTNAGITSDGREYQNRGVTILRLADDRIVEIQDYLDTERITETWPP